MMCRKHSNIGWNGYSLISILQENKAAEVERGEKEDEVEEEEKEEEREQKKKIFCTQVYYDLHINARE